MLINIGGYTANAITEVETYRDPPILLFGTEELEELAGGTADLRQMLRPRASSS